MSEQIQVKWIRKEHIDKDGKPVAEKERMKSTLDLDYTDASLLTESLFAEVGYYSQYHLSERDALKRRLDYLLSILSRLMNDIPTNRDWLNPDLEKEAKFVIKELMTDIKPDDNSGIVPH